MRRLREVVARFRGLMRSLSGDDGARYDARLREEIEAHLGIAADEYERRGMTPEAARRQALLDAGGLTVAVESVRNQRTLPSIESFLRDIRRALRTLRTQRSYTIAVLITLGLGIGATVSMFSILYAVILRPLPYPEPDRIVSLSVANADGDMTVADDRSINIWLEQARSIEALSVYRMATSVLQTSGDPIKLAGTRVMPSYFRVMRLHPIMGRVFTEEEAVADSAQVMLISETLWRNTFGNDPAIVGKSVVMDGAPVIVIGVLPTVGVTLEPSQYWMPYRMSSFDEHSGFFYFVNARLRPDASIESLRSELETLHRRSLTARRDMFKDVRPVVMTLHERMFGPVRSTLVLLFVAVAVLLLITCANLANLTLARAIRRRQEFAVRLALGATRGRIVRYVLTESFLLSIGGALLGVIFSMVAVDYFVRLSPESIADVAGIGVDATVQLFAIGVAILTTILFGMIPAFSAGRNSANLALASSTSRSSGSRSQSALRRMLVVFELATALVLLVGAGLVARTFWNVTSIAPGFEPRELVSTNISLPHNKYTDTTARVLQSQLLTRVRALPGVRAAALAAPVPLKGERMSSTYDRGNGTNTVRFNIVGVSPQYFQTAGTRIIEGRAIDSSAHKDGRGEVVVSARFARLIADTGRAIGRQLTIKERAVTIVGVSEDARTRGLEGDASVVAFTSLADLGGWNSLHLAIRTDESASAIGPAVARVLRELDPTLAPPVLTTMQSVIDTVIAPRKFVFVVLTLFATLAALLAVVGLYGVLSYVVTEQTREIGIRAALGADRWRVMQFVMGQGALLTVIGVVSGLLVAFFAAGSMEKLVYDLSVYDFRTYAAGSLLLVVVSLLASYLPARRASRVDPIVALRAE